MTEATKRKDRAMPVDRHCKHCDCILSRFNRAKVCGPCNYEGKA